MAQETTDKHAGLPMSEESLKEHLKAFSDIEECIEALYKTENGDKLEDVIEDRKHR